MVYLNFLLVDGRIRIQNQIWIRTDNYGTDLDPRGPKTYRYGFGSGSEILYTNYEKA
jgi:hypothetical protein